MLALAPLNTVPAAECGGGVFAALRPALYRPHALHEGNRDWPETNCYIDVWIEILHAVGENPSAALGFTVTQDFEGDHFTFSKMPLEDLYDLYGLDVTELALYDSLETHVVEQTGRGRLVLVEVDGFSLPDTRGISYQLEHTKTTIAINRIDTVRRELDYFHGPGFFTLRAADYDAVFRSKADGKMASLFPYAEFVKFDRGIRRPDANAVAAILRKRLARRPARNPIAAFRERLRDQVVAASGKAPDFLHKYAFNTARQLGMNFELLGSHLAWLDDHTARLEAKTAEGRRFDFGPARQGCRNLSGGAKSFQFQLARAVARKRFDTIETNLDPLIADYDRIMACLSTF